MFSITGGVRVELTRNWDAWILIPTPALTSYRILGKWREGGKIPKGVMNLMGNWSKLL